MVAVNNETRQSQGRTPVDIGPAADRQPFIRIAYDVSQIRQLTAASIGDPDKRHPDQYMHDSHSNQEKPAEELGSLRNEPGEHGVHEQ